MSLHDEACARGASHYVDADTGRLVFTAVGLKARGRCCGCGCRHCPFAHANVQDKLSRIQQPALLHSSPEAPAGPVTVLFWSGGKDSLMSLTALRSQGHRVVLLTTFDAATRMLAHQAVHLRDVLAQAKALRVPLVGVPLHPGDDYVDRVRAGLACVEDAVAGLAFGDIHLESIRQWREETLAGLVSETHYPLWGLSAPELWARWCGTGAKAVISASRDGAPAGLRVGDAFTADSIAAAKQAGWDPFGEHGEFHTLVLCEADGGSP